MLIRTIAVMVFIAAHMPAAKAAPRAGRLPKLLPDKRAREIELLFRFDKIRLESHSLFVMHDRRFRFSEVPEKVGQLLMGEWLGCVERQSMLVMFACFL